MTSCVRVKGIEPVSKSLPVESLVVLHQNFLLYSKFVHNYLSIYLHIYFISGFLVLMSIFPAIIKFCIHRKLFFLQNVLLSEYFVFGSQGHFTDKHTAVEVNFYLYIVFVT